MNILVFTQSYYPDTASVSQHVGDLCTSLVRAGHTVTVVTSLYGYDTPSRYIPYECVEGVNVYRVWQSKLGKRFFIFRAFDFLTINLSMFVRGLRIPKADIDVVLGTTFPPFSALIGLFLSKFKKCKFYFWVLDLQPELSIASGLLKKGSMLERTMTSVGNFLIKNSDRLFSLDRFMTQHLISRGANESSIIQVPVWPVSQSEYIGSRQDNPFRIDNGYGSKCVVMFSGNHAYVHPMDTLLESARILSYSKAIHFSFVGGGVRKRDVTKSIEEHGLGNISQHPFQPRETFHISIAAADIQVVIMGNGQVGYTHPNKIYGAMFLRKPILYIGPSESHITDLLKNVAGNIIVRHGEAEKLANALVRFSNLSQEEVKEIGDSNYRYAIENFHPDLLLDRMVQGISTS